MNFEFLYKSIVQLVTNDWKMILMWIIGGILILGFTLWSELPARKK